MRLRIQTYHPLPDIKAWFIPDVQSTPESVYDLKETLCLRFQALKARKFSGKDLILLLDDFELLNDSPFSAVRDGDLICVKLSPLAQVDDAVVCESNITRQRKRKRSPSETLRISGRSVRAPTVLPKQKAAEPSEGGESDSESDSTTSSAATSSSSASFSSSSSRSSSSPASSSPPKPSTFQPTQQADNMTVPNSTSRIIHPVPPGLGKPSTHSRNKRRRLKKGYERETLSTSLSADAPGPPKGSSYTNKLPLGQRKSEPGPSGHPPDHPNFLPSAKLPSQLPSESNGQDSYITPNQVMMGSLRNKNKKKGFKQSMAAPIPQKIIFTSNTMASGSQEQQPSSSTRDMLTDEITTSAGTIQPRLIPPSEIQELGQLPPNMFVTSVDVESEMWNEQLSSPKKQGKKKTLNGDRYCATTDWHDSSQMEGITENGQFDDADLDTDVLLTTITTQSTISGASRPFDWDRAERLWKESTLLDNLEQLAVGCLVGWKALAINPQTFSPEMLLMVARVVNISQSTLISSESTPHIVIRYLQRPGASWAALAFGLNGEQVEEDEETLEWTDILTRQWRVMQL